MSRARHHHSDEKKAHGGKVRKHRDMGGNVEEVAGGPPQVIKEAKSKKNVGIIEGERAKKRGDRMAVKKGGAVCRARGGKISGSDMNPFSSAHDGGPKTAAGHENEAHENAHKHGGKVHKRAHGGKVEHHDDGHMGHMHRKEHGHHVKKAVRGHGEHHGGRH